MQGRQSAAIESQDPPRIGIPHRRAKEEQDNNQEKIEPYARAVAEAGGEPVLVSLFLSKEEIGRLADGLDAIVLPGSPADVDPARYGEAARPETAEADPRREETDLALLDWAFAEGKPVLAICYGIQLLNVYRGGTLVQDIPSEFPGSLVHQWERERGVSEPHHPARLVPGSLVSRLAETTETVVNSSHHQSIRMPGRDLRVTATSPVVGMGECRRRAAQAFPRPPAEQHPRGGAGEAGAGTRLARALFEDLVRVAREARAAGRHSARAAGIQNEAEGR